MAPPESDQADELPESAAFIGDASTATTLPAAVVDELELSDDDAALIYPTWNEANLAIGFHMEFADWAGPGISGRQLNANPTSGAIQLRFPKDLAQLTGLEAHTVETDTLLRYDVDSSERTIEISVDPPLMPNAITDAEHEQLGETFKDGGFMPSRAADGTVESVRYEVPVEYAREYGFEPQREVGLKFVVRDGSFGVAIDLDPDLDDEHTLFRSMNYYGDTTQTEDMYAITIPKTAIHALRWTLDMPIRTVPLEGHILVMPANPIPRVDGHVDDATLVDELGEQKAEA